jgi:hypothetical protein
MRTRLAALLIPLLALGCVTTQVYRSGTGATYPPTKADAVLVFFSAEDVKRPYEVIAEILTEASSYWGWNDSSLVDGAQKKAAALGANAIIVTKEKGAGAASAMLFGANDRKQQIKAIRFTTRRIRTALDRFPFLGAPTVVPVVA